MKKYISILVYILILVTQQACAHPSFYKGAEIRGQVVDAETKEPIEGVVVVAQWKLYCANFVDGWHCRVLHVHESVTDSNGNYVIPAWGPKARPVSTYLDTSDPMLSYFKRGYNYLTLGNSDIRYFREGLGQEKLDAMSFEEFDNMIQHIAPEHKRSLRESVWDGRKIELKKFVGTNEDLYWLLSGVYDGLLNLDNEREGIPLLKVKRTAKEWSEFLKDFKQEKIYKIRIPDHIQKMLEEELK